MPWFLACFFFGLLRVCFIGLAGDLWGPQRILQGIFPVLCEGKVWAPCSGFLPGGALPDIWALIEHGSHNSGFMRRSLESSAAAALKKRALNVGLHSSLTAKEAYRYL